MAETTTGAQAPVTHFTLKPGPHKPYWPTPQSLVVRYADGRKELVITTDKRARLVAFARERFPVALMVSPSEFDRL